jgi:cysteinyl-tRNA synthetase
MDDDFNTPQAVAVLFDLAREINRGHDEKLHIGKAHKLLGELAGVLGLTLYSELTEPEIPLHLMEELAIKHNVVLKDSEDISTIISRFSGKRLELRRSRKWQLADSIRNDLKELGITLEDTPQGTVWRYKKP